MGRRTGYVLAFGLAYAALTEVYQGLLPFDRTVHVTENGEELDQKNPPRIFYLINHVYLVKK